MFTLLFHAVIESWEPGFMVLLDSGADPTLANNRSTTVLQLIAKRNLTSWADHCVKKMDKSQRQRFVNLGSSNGWTPLMSAAENNAALMVTWLIKNGAVVNIAMDTGWTAMHAAAKKNSYDILKILLENGGDKNLEAVHRDFGRNLKVEDVTVDERLLELLKKYK